MEEAASIAVIAQTARWLAGSGGVAANSTEARIARLLDDLHTHLEMVEGLHESMRRAMEDATGEDANRPHLDPAPPEVLAAISDLRLEAPMLKTMRQTAQCVVCCADFECGEHLSQLPGCSHLFHPDCIRQWLERASNCPICRRDLVEATGERSPEPASALSGDPSAFGTLLGPESHRLQALMALSNDDTAVTPGATGSTAPVPTPASGSQGRTTRRSNGAGQTSAIGVSPVSQQFLAGVGAAPSNGLRSNISGQTYGSLPMGMGASLDTVAVVRRPASSSVLVGAGSSTIAVPASPASSGQPPSPSASSGLACNSGTMLPPVSTGPSGERQSVGSRGFAQRR